MKYKAILFDLDGTLTDSGEGIMNCAEVAFRRLGMDVPSREKLRIFVGPPLHETFIQFGVPDERADEAVAYYRERYIPIGAYENVPYPGIREMLETLQKEGHRLYIATSKPEGMSKKILEHFDLAKYFTRICGAGTDRSRSTKESVIAYLLEETGEAETMIMVGDTVYDVIGAKTLGIPCIGVSWGYGDVPEMEQAGALGIAWTVENLLSMLRG